MNIIKIVYKVGDMSLDREIEGVFNKAFIPELAGFKNNNLLGMDFSLFKIHQEDYREVYHGYL